MSYLIIEGYESAATKFAEEAGITPRISTDCIADRVQIRSAINRGDIIDAIRLINELNPEVSPFSLTPLTACTYPSRGCRYEEMDEKSYDDD